jgi:hypothetical protein
MKVFHVKHFPKTFELFIGVFLVKITDYKSVANFARTVFYLPDRVAATSSRKISFLAGRLGLQKSVSFSTALSDNYEVERSMEGSTEQLLKEIPLPYTMARIIQAWALNIPTTVDIVADPFRWGELDISADIQFVFGSEFKIVIGKNLNRSYFNHNDSINVMTHGGDVIANPSQCGFGEIWWSALPFILSSLKGRPIYNEGTEIDSFGFNFNYEHLHMRFPSVNFVSKILRNNDLIGLLISLRDLLAESKYKGVCLYPRIIIQERNDKNGCFEVGIYTAGGSIRKTKEDPKDLSFSFLVPGHFYFTPLVKIDPHLGDSDLTRKVIEILLGICTSGLVIDKEILKPVESFLSEAGEKFGVSKEVIAQVKRNRETYIG